MRVNAIAAALAGVGILAGAAQARTAGVPAAAPAAPAAAASTGADAATLQKGGDLFVSFACGSCHSLQDAGATGHVGPSFDGNAHLDQAFIVDRVSNGAGLMPSFAGQMTPAEVAAVAAYVLHTKTG